MQKSFLIAISVSLYLATVVSPALCVEKQFIAGAGPSTKVVELFVKEFSGLPAAKGYTFEVPPKSSKHAGGIQATDYYVFGRTGRPLNAKEKALNKGEIFLARIPIAFVVGSNAGVSTLNVAQVEDIFAKKIDNWKMVGGADHKILTIGREQTEALFTVLKRNNPAFNNVKFDKVLNRDHHVVSFIQFSQGDYAIAFGAKPNFDAKALTVLDVGDFSVGVEVGLVYDMKNKGHELVKAVKDFVKSPVWAKAVKGMGLLPPK